MELRQLEYLIAVAEAASFSRAAKRLGVAQPSISEQVKKLEREVGQPLLDRLTRRVLPTPAGEMLIGHGRKILAEVAEARRRVADAAGAGGRPVGRLTVGAIPTVAPFLLPRLVRLFERRYPGVELMVVEDTTPRLVERIVRGELDVAVASTAAEAGPLHVEVVAEEPLLLMMSAKHKLARLRSIPAGAVAGERFVALHEMHCLAGQSERFCMRREPQPPVVMHGNNLFTLAAMVSAGMGVTLVPQMMAGVRGGATARGCVFRPFRGEAPTRPITLLWSVLRYRTLAARAFAEMAGGMLVGGAGARGVADRR